MKPKRMTWATTLAIDFDKWATRVYRANFPDTEVRCARVADELDRLPDADVITGGFPCQPHSLAGKRKASADERDGGMDFVDAIRRVKPRMFLGENVPGILSSENGRYMHRLFAAMEESGYVVEVRALDAVSFGVPQFRNRVWFWGIRRDLYADGIRHCWPTPTHAWPPPGPGLFGDALLPGVTVGQALGLEVYIHRGQRGSGLVERCGEREASPTTEPCPTVTDATNGSGRLFLQSHADPAQTIHKPAPSLRSGGGGHDGCCLRLGYDHGVADPYKPCPTLKGGGNYDRFGKQGGGCPPLLCHWSDAINVPSPTLVGGTITRVHAVLQGHGAFAGGDFDLRQPSPTLRNCITGCGDMVLYHWSDAMLQKHPPASPAPTVQAKYHKGGAEGLLDVTNINGTMSALARNVRPQSVLQENDRPGAEPPRAFRASRRGRSIAHGANREILQALRKAVGEEAFRQWGIGICESVGIADILQQSLHEGGISCQSHTDSKELVGCSCEGQEVMSAGDLSEVWQAGCERRTPSKWKLAGQLAKQLRTYLSQLSHSPSSRQAGLYDLWQASEGIGLLQSALSSLQEMGRSDDREGQSIHGMPQRGRSESDSDLFGPVVWKESSRSQILQPSRYAGNKGQNVPLYVRRLTVWECMRLQSVPDDFIWPDDLPKTHAYKIVGNGWATRMGAVFADAFHTADPDSQTIIDLYCGGGLGACGWHGNYWEYDADRRSLFMEETA